MVLQIKLPDNPTATSQEKGETIAYTYRNGLRRPYIKHYETPEVSRLRNAYKILIKNELKRQGIKDYTFDGPVFVSLTFAFKTKEKKKLGTFKDTKPDCDNIAKLLIDAMADLNFFKVGDQQIVRLNVFKFWHTEPGVVIYIEPEEHKVYEDMNNIGGRA